MMLRLSSATTFDEFFDFMVRPAVHRQVDPTPEFRFWQRASKKALLVNDDSYSLFPVWIASLFKTNGQRTVGIGSLVASPADGPPHTFDLNFSSQNDLLSVHVLWEDDRGLAQFARDRLARVEIASYFNSAVSSLGVDA